MIITLESGTVYKLAADGNRLEISITKNGKASDYMAPINSKMKGGIIVITRDNGSKVELPVRKIGIEDEFRLFMNENK